MNLMQHGMNAIESLFFIRNELFLIGIAFLILILDFFTTKKSALGWIAILSLFGAIFIPTRFFPTSSLFFGHYTLDTFTQFFRWVSYLATSLSLLASLAYGKIPLKQRGEFYFLMLLLATLLPFMAGATNLLMVFLAIESVSITSYILVGFQKFDKKSAEASLKYLLFGSVSSAVMLFGMSLLYGATQSIWFSEISIKLQTSGFELLPIGLVGLLFMLVGIGFKISMVPFHMWAPDVYQGAPTPITAFLTVAPKALGFAVMARVLLMLFPQYATNWSALLTCLSILTMTIGNIIAISQSDLKRLLAYSSIAQAGYILAGLATPGSLGLQAILIYIAAYLFTNLGAFFCVLAIERDTGSSQIEACRGLSERAPFLSLALVIFLLSLAGIPPLAGFLGKFYIFAAAVDSKAIVLAVAIAINSAVAAYYYFRIIRMAYLEKIENKTRLLNPAPLNAAIIVALAGTLFIGFYPAFIIQIVEKSLLEFFLF